MSFKKLSSFVILPILSNILLSNELEKNKILNIMVDHNYDLTDQKYGNLETFFCFPFLFNDSEEIKSAMNVRELKKLLKKKRKELPKNHSHIDWKKMDVKIMNEGILQKRWLSQPRAAEESFSYRLEKDGCETN